MLITSDQFCSIYSCYKVDLRFNSDNIFNNNNSYFFNSGLDDHLGTLVAGKKGDVDPAVFNGRRILEKKPEKSFRVCKKIISIWP